MAREPDPVPGEIWIDAKGTPREVTRVVGDWVYWRTPGGNERKQPKWIKHWTLDLTRRPELTGPQVDAYVASSVQEAEDERSNHGTL